MVAQFIITIQFREMTQNVITLLYGKGTTPHNKFALKTLSLIL